MTTITRTERYQTNACMDREDALAMAGHLRVLAPILAAARGPIAVASCDDQTRLHYARLVRILQRATQPNVVGQAACQGVERITLVVENGASTFTVRTGEAELVLDSTARRMRLDAARSNVVAIEQPEQRRRYG